MTTNALPSISGRERRQIILIVIFGAALRLVGLGSQIMQEDEWSNVEFLPLGEIFFHGYETTTNPPLFYLIQHFIYPLSTDPFWFRLPAAIAGIALIYAVWLAAREFFTPTVGLWSALFVSMHPSLIVWSQTARAYIPLTLLIVLCSRYAVRLIKGGSDRDAVYFALIASLAIWTHYLSLLSLFVFFVLIAIFRYASKRDLVRLFLIGFWLFIVFLPLMPYFFFNMTDKQGAGLWPNYTQSLVGFLSGFPFVFGWIALALIAFSGIWKKAEARYLLLFVAGVLSLNIYSSNFTFLAPAYSIQLVPFVVMLFAASLRRITPDKKGVLRGFVLLQFMTSLVVIGQVPEKNVITSDMAMIYLQRGVSHKVFANEIIAKTNDQSKSFTCTNILTTPAFDIELYPYHFNKLTLKDIGMQPFVEHGNHTFSIPPDESHNIKGFKLKGIESDPSNSEALNFSNSLTEFGCFWYSRMHQNCENKQGLFYLEADCQWLKANCIRISATAHDELYYCDGKGKLEESQKI